MLVKYFASDGTIYEIDAPHGTAVLFESHRRDQAGAFRDDVLVVPWRGKRIGLEGEVAWRSAQEGILGLRLVRVTEGDHASMRAVP